MLGADNDFLNHGNADLKSAAAHADTPELCQGRYTPVCVMNSYLIRNGSEEFVRQFYRALSYFLRLLMPGTMMQQFRGTKRRMSIKVIKPAEE